MYLCPKSVYSPMTLTLSRAITNHAMMFQNTKVGISTLNRV